MFVFTSFDGALRFSPEAGVSGRAVYIPGRRPAGNDRVVLLQDMKIIAVVP